MLCVYIGEHLVGEEHGLRLLADRLFERQGRNAWLWRGSVAMQFVHQVCVAFVGVSSRCAKRSKLLQVRKAAAFPGCLHVSARQGGYFLHTLGAEVTPSKHGQKKVRQRAVGAVSMVGVSSSSNPLPHAPAAFPLPTHAMSVHDVALNARLRAAVLSHVNTASASVAQTCPCQGILACLSLSCFTWTFQQEPSRREF